MLVNGKWSAQWDPIQAKDEKGRFIRQTSWFRNWITPDGRPGPSGRVGFSAELDRYHLYVALICPWASRALMVRKLKGLDVLNGAEYLHELYTKADPDYTGRATVPVLWDKHLGTIVNNESADIIRMLNHAFDAFADKDLDLYPKDLRSQIDTLNEQLYEQLNNGVYQAGFASSQSAYEDAYNKVFAMLDVLEERLSDGRCYLFGDRLTESDIRLFVTLVRFDVAYHGVFKCNRNLISQMPALCEYVTRVLALPGVAETVNVDHIKAGYYSVKALNPTGIVPVGPALTGRQLRVA